MKPALVAWLSDTLADYSFAHPSETETVEAFRALLDHADDIADPAHYLPGHLTASAFAVDRSGEALLLVHHAKLGRWLQPGGHVDPADHSLEGAARRELEEETGLAQVESLGLFDLDVHRIPERGDVPSHDHYDVRFGFRSRHDDITAGEGVHEAVWARLDALGEHLTDSSVVRAAAKLRRLIR